MSKPDTDDKRSTITWNLRQGEALVIDDGFVTIRHIPTTGDRTRLKVTLPRNVTIKAVDDATAQ